MISSMSDLHSVAAYLQRIGAEPRSLRVAVVKEQHGDYWTDIATIRIDKQAGTIDAPEGFEPTEGEAAMIKSEVLAADWPSSVTLGKGFELPPELKASGPDSIFELRNAEGRLVMIQQRVDDPKSGEKRYVPWCYWSDDKWRKAEPEGPLPLYGLDKLHDNTTVFIHEGAKAARAMQRLINPRTAEEKAALAAHPWGDELQGAAHIGWIGGALSPSRTDWSPLARLGVQRAYIVADNDRPGKAAVPKIAQRLKGITTFSIEFTDIWPTSFDLADDFPPKMFTSIGGVKHYVGPSFRDVLHPATWATDLMPNPSGKGKPVPVLRKEFCDLWLWIEETDTFICRENPEINHSIAQFNSMVGAFSHVNSTGQLLTKSYKGRVARVCYRPDIPHRIVTDKTTSAINLHSPATIKKNNSSPQPWIEFLHYLFPIERERNEVKRWCATLIAHPEVRMLYGMLLVSERQGMGKSTLGERILAPLVGLHNTGFPGERDIVESNFNGWVARKRLVVVGEIYTGQSFKAYNTLKSYITDKNIEVNEKFQRPYKIENWAHVIACSNSKKALRIEETDRRWFYPTLAEVPWSKTQWGEFYGWLNSGGLGSIAQWAEEYGNYVQTGEHAPMTANKKDLIDESRGEVINHWVDILAAVEAENEAVVFALSEVRDTLKRVHGKVFETPLTLKKEALRAGWETISERVSVDGALSYVVVSPALIEEMKKHVEKGDKKALRAWAVGEMKRVKDRVQGGM